MTATNIPDIPSYVVITPARNEARYIGRTVEGVIGQTVAPAEWVIIDDGSTDGTSTIISQYRQQHPWMTCVPRTDRGSRNSSVGAIEAFDYGRGQLQTSDWEFLVNLDADVELPPTYFQDCFAKFREQPDLGIAGGTLFSVQDGVLREEICPAHHVRGAMKIYRRSCWDQIGGLTVSPGWDTIDEIKANMLGWKTRSFRDIRAFHQRTTGGTDGAWRDNLKNGKADYVVGYHPLFMIAKCLKRLFMKPYFVGSAALLAGFVSAYLHETPRLQSKEVVHHLRKQHMRRLLLWDGMWR